MVKAEYNTRRTIQRVRNTITCPGLATWAIPSHLSPRYRMCIVRCAATADNHHHTSCGSGARRLLYVLHGRIEKFMAGNEIRGFMLAAKTGNYLSVTPLDHLVEEEVVSVNLHLPYDSLISSYPCIGLFRGRRIESPGLAVVVHQLRP